MCLLTGYIPKAWICKTLNLHLNRSVCFFSFIFLALQFVQTKWLAGTQCCFLACIHLVMSVISYSSSVHPLDSIAGLLDPSLLYHQWISASFLLFTWHITLLLFRIFVTEVCDSITSKGSRSTTGPTGRDRPITCYCPVVTQIGLTAVLCCRNPFCLLFNYL